MPMPAGRRDIGRVGLTPSADAADGRQALLIGAEPAIGRSAKVTVVISAPRTILRVRRGADRSYGDRSAEEKKRERIRVLAESYLETRPLTLPKARAWR